MSDDQHRFLMLLRRLPARLTAAQVAWVLNCQPQDVPILVAARLLKPLGNPLPNGLKYFATGDVVELGKDRTWLTKATNSLNQYWRTRNAKRHFTSVGLGGLDVNCQEDCK